MRTKELLLSEPQPSKGDWVDVHYVNHHWNETGFVGYMPISGEWPDISLDSEELDFQLHADPHLRSLVHTFYQMRQTVETALKRGRLQGSYRASGFDASYVLYWKYVKGGQWSLPHRSRSASSS